MTDLGFETEVGWSLSLINSKPSYHDNGNNLIMYYLVTRYQTYRDFLSVYHGYYKRDYKRLEPFQCVV